MIILANQSKIIWKKKSVIWQAADYMAIHVFLCKETMQEIF